MSNLKDITGQRFGRLVVIERKGTTQFGQSKWLCLCDCGNTTIANSSNLRSGNKKSCGCLRKSNCVKMGKARKKEHRDSKLFVVWRSMKQRCLNPKSKAYVHYGGRGITVCDEWKNSYEVFYKWAMANGYDENAPRGQCTIDRIDNDKGYSPDNCRWTTMVVQNNNQRSKKGGNYDKKRKETNPNDSQ